MFSSRHSLPHKEIALAWGAVYRLPFAGNLKSFNRLDRRDKIYLFISMNTWPKPLFWIVVVIGIADGLNL